jgi:hypothetical protein
MIPLPTFARFKWQRDERNPILRPAGASSYDGHSWINPFMLPVGAEVWLNCGNGHGATGIGAATAPTG